ncbi:hypothetical protein AYL99_00570 [Fonsecaea erecta]|uniref:Uncharacterized protein n=1 Tax=Fonsecaea erecta TaxID=1367422 RepID=A0A178ZXN3_9EURO|nr:hypothetical protein AYL99_00570 [Fonsecaea erecta]OAP64598.1 hypothetical protein AYL99_00570 [Fonsecaea erecta]
MPILGVVLFVFGTFFISQSIFVYVPVSSPRYAASLFMANDLSQSSFAAGSILFARGVTILASISVLGGFGMFALHYYGAKLRARSSFAQA